MVIKNQGVAIQPWFQQAKHIKGTICVTRPFSLVGMVATLAISKVHQVQTFSCRMHSVGPPQTIEPLLDQFAISSQPWSMDLLIHRDILHAALSTEGSIIWTALRAGERSLH